MKKVDVTVQTTIAAPVGIVSSYASDPEHAPEWYVNIKFAERLSPNPFSLGSQIRFRARFLGRDLLYTYEVTEFIPHEKLVMETADGPFPMKTTYTWQAIEKGSTLMSLRNFGRPAGFPALLIPLMSMLMRRANKKDLQNLKSILEKRSQINPINK